MAIVKFVDSVFSPVEVKEDVEAAMKYWGERSFTDSGISTKPELELVKIEDDSEGGRFSQN